MAPVADAGPDQFTQTLTPASFSGAGCSDADGSIVSYGWNFGDGASAPGAAPSHTYMTAGTYTVVLTVTDDAGISATDTATVSVANRAPAADAGPDQTAAAGAAVTLNGSVSADPDGTITSYLWTFEGGVTAAGTTVSHTYAAVGTYVATLTVTDDRGAQGTDTATITVTAASAGPALRWGQRFGSAGTDSAEAVAIDGAGNVVMTGQITAPADLGSGAPCSSSIFVTKYSAAGAHLWTQCPGSGIGSGRAIAIDAVGNVLVAGNFRGTVDFGRGPLTSAGGYDIFVAKYAADGTPLWSQRFGSSLSSAVVTESGLGVAVDGSGDVMLTGMFDGTVDFGGGPLASAGGSDVFVARYSAAGAHLWSQRFGGMFTDVGNAVAVDGDGNAVVTGRFLDPVDFGGGVLASAGYDVFLAKFTPAGAHVWSQRLGGALYDSGNAVAVDGGGNLVLTGTYMGTVDFGGGPLTSLGDNDIFVAKYSPAGEHLWSRGFGNISANDSGNSVAVDDTGAVLITGIFSYRVDFGGGRLTNAGGSDVVVAKYSAAGTHLWSQRYGGTGIDEGHSVAVDSSGNVALVGRFSNRFDSAPSLTSAGQTDIFLLSLGQ
jgi:PKD repeat protein